MPHTSSRRWGNFSDKLVKLLHFAVDRTSGSNVTIRAHMNNLAATDPDTPLGQAAIAEQAHQQTYEGEVMTAALDDLVGTQEDEELTAGSGLGASQAASRRQDIEVRVASRFRKTAWVFCRRPAWLVLRLGETSGLSLRSL